MRGRRSIAAGVDGDAAGAARRTRKVRAISALARPAASMPRIWVRLNSRIGQYRLPSARPDAKAEILGAHHSGPFSQPDKKGADQSVGTSLSR